mmetsp:Transcript_20841/g.32153  ORF Transcript_20841/g.32153 Transcript_20841/m.32153 type:complete len:105 (+) Transcript_20841:1040-1354(+)
MVEKYKIPVDPLKATDSDSKFEQFNIDVILKNLALNKHNDFTTTYYLLHKKWLNDLYSASRKKAKFDQAAENPLLFDSAEDLVKSHEVVNPENSLITLTPQNYE